MKDQLIIAPYEGLGIFKFTDNVEAILSKCHNLTGKGIKSELLNEIGTIYHSVYVEDYMLHIILYEDGNSVRYFEIFSDVHHMDINLHRERYSNIRQYYTEKDENIIINEIDESFDTPRYGFIVAPQTSSRSNSVLIYSKIYKQEPFITPDDIIQYCLGYNPLNE